MKTKFRLLGVLALAGLLTVTYSMAMAGDHSSTANNNNTPSPQAAQQSTSDTQAVPYLGIGVQPVQTSLWSHLRDLFGREQGVMVMNVADGSPAQMAGLERHDILLTYNDQKLYSPDQLAKLVRSDKVGSEVTLGIVRQGKKQTIKVTLGERQFDNQQHVARNFPQHVQAPQWFTNQNSSAHGSNWQDFDSMTLKNLGNHQFKVEIKYLNQDGKLEAHAFKGTMDEIHKAINHEKDLPNLERNQLLRSLNLPGYADEPFEEHAMPSHTAWLPGWGVVNF